MSKELRELKKKIEVAQKKKQFEDQIKSKEKFSNTISNAVSKVRTLEEEKNKLERSEKRKNLIITSLKFVATILFCVLSLTIVIHAISEPPHHLVKLTKIDDRKKTSQIISLSEQIYKIFISNDIDEIKKIAARLDDGWIYDIKSILTELDEPPLFTKCKIFSPDHAEGLIYAFVPTNKNFNLQFVFKQNTKNNFTLEGIYINEN